MPTSNQTLEQILNKAAEGRPLTKKEIVFLLEVEDEHQQEAIFKTARNLRQQHFGEKVFLYGFLYISTYCRNDCSFCFFRKSNITSQRYRKDEEEIVAAARELTESGVHLIDLTMGEDPAFLHNGHEGVGKFIRLVESVRAATGAPIMVSSGVVAETILQQLATVGVTWYACYQETHQRNLYHRLRPGQRYDERFELKRSAHRLGLLIEEGVLRGVGESSGDIADSVEAMRFLDADQVRVMNFVPQKGTPLANRMPLDSRQELLTTAILRLSFPDRLVPASLDVDGLAGLKQRLRAGANVVTSLVPPGQGFAGVAQSSLDIADGRRSRAMVEPVLHESGLIPASMEEYLTWIKARHKVLAGKNMPEAVAC